MRWFLFYILLIVSAFGLLWAFRNRERLYQFPAVLSAGMLVYIIPQAWSVVRGEGFPYIPDDAYFIGMLYTIACVIFAYLGYFSGRASPPRVRITYDADRLFQIGFAVLAIGTLGRLALNLYSGGLFAFYSESGAYTIQWRGWPVYFAFLARLTIPGLAICFIATLLKPTLMRYGILLIGLVYPVANVVFLGRRSWLFALVAIVLFSLYFLRGYRPSRNQFVAGMAVALAVVVLFPAYRGHLQYNDPDQEMLGEIDPMEEIERYFSGEKTTPFPYALLNIGLGGGLGDHYWGAGIYNRAVDQFLPALFVGDAFKEALMLPIAHRANLMRREYGFSTPTYLAPTGFASTFNEFSYLGVLAFFAIGRLFRKIYERATRWRDMKYMMLGTFFALHPAVSIYQSWEGMIVQAIPPLVIWGAINRYCGRRQRIALRGATSRIGASRYAG